MAWLAPVFVGGVTVTNATLHNLFEIRKKRVRGATRSSRARGRRDPEVVGVVPRPARSLSAQLSHAQGLPHAAPWCARRARLTTAAPAACFAWRSAREALLHFAARHIAMDIDGLGDKTGGPARDHGVIRTLARPVPHGLTAS